MNSKVAQQLFAEIEESVSVHYKRSPNSGLEKREMIQDSDSSDDVEDLDEISRSVKNRRRNSSSSSPKNGRTTKKKNKVCEFCGTNDTPMWRRGPNGKGTLCNACGVKWSLQYRKKNAAKEATAVSKKGRREEMEEDAREKKRRIYDSEENADSTSDDDSEKTGNKLFGSLLNVVEHKLVEAQELEEIRRELHEWRKTMQEREEQRQKALLESQQRFSSELADFRKQIMALLAVNELSVNTKLEKVESQVQQVALQSMSMKQDMDQMRLLLKKELVAAFASKMEGVESKLTDLQTQVTNNFTNVKHQVHTQFDTMKGKLENGLAKTQKLVDSELEKVAQGRDSELQLQMHRIEALLAQTNTIPYPFVH